MKVGIVGHCLVMVGVAGYFVEVAVVVECWEEEEEEGEVEGDQREEEEEDFGEEEEEVVVGYLVMVGEFVGAGA